MQWAATHRARDTPRGTGCSSYPSGGHMGAETSTQHEWPWEGRGGWAGSEEGKLRPYSSGKGGTGWSWAVRGWENEAVQLGWSSAAAGGGPWKTYLFSLVWQPLSMHLPGLGCDFSLLSHPPLYPGSQCEVYFRLQTNTLHKYLID